MTGSAVELEWAGDVAVVHLANPPVNAATVALRRALLSALRELASNRAVRGTVLVGDGQTFIAGSDLAEFAGPISHPPLPTVIAALAASPTPVVAALDGHALGGGLEVALGCDARVATPRTRLGLPEVSLGMVPGAGGTQRLPRLIGVAAATDLVCTSRRVEAIEAIELGLIDALVEREDLVAQAVELTRRITQPRRTGRPPRPARRILIPAGRPNVRAAARLVQLATRVDLAVGLRIERAAFHRYRRSADAAALRHLFFAERAAARPFAEPPPVVRPIVGSPPVVRPGLLSARLVVAAPTLVRWTGAGRDLVEVCCSDEAALGGAAEAVAAVRRAGQLAVVSRPRAGSAGDALRRAAQTAIDDLCHQVGDAAVATSLRRFGYTWRPLDATGGPTGSPALAEAVSRAVADTAAALVADGVLAGTGDADVLAVAAVGFPRFRGGPLWWVGA